MHRVFVTGGTGYIGQPLIRELLAREHQVRALVRPGSEHKLPPGCSLVLGDAVNGGYAGAVDSADTFIHLIGTPHPNPAKAAEFRRVDLASIRSAVSSASAAGVAHFIYVSVAHPAPIMRAYIEVRSEGESLIRASGLNATILRPWYVLGPGRRWPVTLKPVYWLAGHLPGARAGAQRLGLVTLDQVVSTLARAVEQPSTGVQIVEVPAIRAAAASAGSR
jgi:nucleoside-diphosphate-sugar epimerase